MDESTYSIRPFVDADFEPESRIWTANDPEWPLTAEQLRHWHHVSDDPKIFRHLLSVDERTTGSMVGVGHMFNAIWSYDPDRYWLGIAVMPTHQNRGIGQKLFDLLEAVARERHGKALWANVRDDRPRDVRFFERNGFRELRRTWNSILDLSTARLSPPTRTPEEWSREGIVFTTLAEEGPTDETVRRRVYKLHELSGQDVPRVGPPTQLSFEQYVRLALEAPGVRFDGIFLARSGEQYVAMTDLGTAQGQPDTLDVGFTGTLREFRGRGIATELKRRATLYAQRHGFRYVRTTNDSLNKAMWGINERLGYRRERVNIHGEKTLSP